MSPILVLCCLVVKFQKFLFQEFHKKKKVSFLKYRSSILFKNLFRSLELSLEAQFSVEQFL